MTAAASVPADIDQERELISACLDMTGNVRICMEAGIKAEHFYLDTHRAMWRGIATVVAGGHQAEPFAIWATMERMGLAAPANPDGPDKDRFFGFVGAWSNLANTRPRAQHLIYLADKRAKLKGAQHIIEGVQHQEEAEYRRLLQTGLEEIAVDYEIDAEPTTPEEIALFIHDYIESDEDPEVFELPWAELNPLILGGLRRGQTSLLAGWTNFGKSIVLDQELTAFHSQGKRCGLFVTEMSLLERMARKVAAATSVPAERFLLKKMTNEEKVKVAKAMVPEKIPFHFYDAQGWTYDRLAQRIAIGTPAGPFDVVAIDPINLIPGFGDQEVLTEAARRFQEVARRVNCHLIMVAHLNRGRAQQAELPKPVLRDIRDSGMLANNADQVLFLHRDQDEEGEVLPTGEVYWGKVRNGMKGGIPVTLNSHVQFIKHAHAEPAAPWEGIGGPRF